MLLFIRIKLINLSTNPYTSQIGFDTALTNVETALKQC